MTVGVPPMTPEALAIQKEHVRRHPPTDASAAVIETKITQVVEDSIAGIEGILSELQQDHPHVHVTVIDHSHGGLADLAGHGASAALHAASVINIMRKKALPGVDMRQT